MTDLERRLEAALKAARSDARKLLKRFTKARQKAEERVHKSWAQTRLLEDALTRARHAETGAAKKVLEDEQQKKLAGRIDYNYKVRNR